MIWEADPFLRAPCWKRCFRCSTRGRNGTCCRSAIRTTRRSTVGFQQWCEREILREVLAKLANELHERGETDESKCFIDATFAGAKGGGAKIGPTRRGKGLKILAIVDRQGLPLSVSTHGANHHEVTLVQLSFDFYMLEVKPENLIGDKAYDSAALEESLKAQGVDLGCCHLKDEMTRRSNFLGEPSLSERISGTQTSEAFEKPRKALPVETRCLDLETTNA
jgi:hypothetical protein